jgi:glycosyltransferase involved in cell wall biosynthesis
MLRVLHLLPKSVDHQTDTAIAQLCGNERDEIGHEAITLGRGGDYAMGAAAIIALRRRGADADVIHAWGQPALFVAAVGCKQQIIYSPTEFPRKRSVRWLRTIMAYRQVQVVCSTETMRRAFVEHGVPMDRCHLIRPGVDFARINERRDPALRSALGFAEEDQVFLAVGESTRGADHPRAAWAAVVLHVLDRRNKLLIWGRGPLAEKTSRFVHRLGQPDLCCVATERLSARITFEQLLPAVDVALVTAAGPFATLPIAVCMAAGLPIVGVVTPTVSELLKDQCNAMMVATASPRAIARRVLDLREDPRLQSAICDRARTEAHESFSQTRFVRNFGRFINRCVRARKLTSHRSKDCWLLVAENTPSSPATSNPQPATSAPSLEQLDAIAYNRHGHVSPRPQCTDRWPTGSCSRLLQHALMVSIPGPW